MNCPICSQWNPPAARRCAFCGNDPGGELDQTANGQPPRMLPGDGGAARAPPSHVAQPQLSRPQQARLPGQTPESDRAFRIAVGVMAVGAVCIVLSLLVRC